VTYVSVKRHALAAEAVARSATGHGDGFPAQQLASAVAELSRAGYELASTMNAQQKA